MQHVDAPAEAYVTSTSEMNPRQISNANPVSTTLPVGKTEHLRWNSSDGTEIEGLLTYPVGYSAGTRVPLLLIVHGGPAGVFMQTFIGNPGVYPTAAFASNGYAVLRCNPRGSSGYGESFRSANRKDWGGGDYRDLMSGVDKVIEMGVADPDRMGVMGWSYGGYMTSWIITQTNRFKAASVGAGVTNLMSFNGTADIPSFIPDYFEAQSWENLELYRDHSPMFQVQSVQTPTLIVHGEADIRVPISQGYELYNALRQRRIETRMLVLPRQPHGPVEPKLMLKNMEANLEWFVKYVKP
jgi:dipeptidyl aminopeptidase/acylaminoacyl peptidase